MDTLRAVQRRGWSFSLLTAIAAMLAAITTSAAGAGRPLVTGISDGPLFASRDAPTAFRRVKATGSTTVVLELKWADVAPAPRAARPPKHFRANDPSDPKYHWDSIDRQVKLAAGLGLEPIMVIDTAPRWVQPKSSEVAFAPDPGAFGRFAHAAAVRYSGRFQLLPRVRYWQAWSEPNITTFLLPQLLGGKPFSPTWYRNMLNAFARGVHTAAPGNVVIAGGLAPFRDSNISDLWEDWGPLTFMRFLLCLSADLKPTCKQQSTFDVWSTHPYTSGGPTHHAFFPDDVSLGDLPEMHRVLVAAQRVHHIRTGPRGLGFWVTEFSWDSNRPDPKAVPLATLQQWVPLALYDMWRNRITHVDWFTLRDLPMSDSPYQSGLYFNGGSFARDRPKPFLANFRFPVVLVPQANGGFVWGRTPAGRPARVAVQTTTPSGWRTLGHLTSNRFGIFQGYQAGPFGAYVRAVIVKTGDASGRFPTTPIPDRFYNPFGTTPPLEQG